MHLPLLNTMVVNEKHILATHVFIVAFYLITLSFKKLFYKVRYDRDFYVVPRLQIKSISGVSMMTAMNIALIVSISLLSNQIMGIFFKVYPGARFLIENVLVKLGGIMFGPLIGIFIGFTTDLFTVILTSSVLNYGYFFSAMINGFMGGIVCMILKMKDPRKINQAIASIGMSLFALTYLGYLLCVNSSSAYFAASILSFKASLHWAIVFGLIVLVVLACAGCLIFSIFSINHLHNPKYSYNKWIKFFADNYLFLLILMCNCSIYLLVDIASLPLFDIKISALPYEQFLITRIITSVPALILFSYLIHYIYKLQISIKGGYEDAAASLEYGLQEAKPTKRKTFLPNVLH